VHVATVSFGLIIALAAGFSAAARSPRQPPAPQTPPPVAQPPGAPATPPPAVPASRRFTSDAGMIFSVIKADKTADFELVMTRVKDGLAKSQDPKRKQQALSWRVFKGLEPAPGGGVLYVWFIDPPVKDAEYIITDILTEAFPNEAQDLWARYIACFASGQTMLNLAATLNMSPVK
jgi:hypothetical protein